MTTKPHLSDSQLGTYCRCPESWRRRHIEKEIIPPGIAMMIGTGFHGGAKANMQQKKETHVDLPADDIQDAAAAAFEAQVAGGYVLEDDEMSRGSAAVIGEALDMTVKLAGVHAKEQAPDYQPVLVEERIRIELPMARDFLGIIDLADDKDRVIDFKTAGKRKPQSEADNSVQLTGYAAAFKARTGRAPSELRLDSVVKAKKGAYRDVLVTTRGDADLAALGHRIDAVGRAIDAGIFPPATPGAWWCGPKWCGYWHTCKYVNSERRAAADQGMDNP